MLAWCSALHQSQFGNGKRGAAEGGPNSRPWTVAFVLRIPFKQNKDNTGQNPNVHISVWNDPYPSPPGILSTTARRGSVPTHRTPIPLEYYQ